jgi:hypothetical protein
LPYKRYAIGFCVPVSRSSIFSPVNLLDQYLIGCLYLDRSDLTENIKSDSLLRFTSPSIVMSDISQILPSSNLIF